MNDRPEMECRGSGPTVENGFFELRSIPRLDRKPQIALNCTRELRRPGFVLVGVLLIGSPVS